MCEKEGYANLRCVGVLGCRMEIQPWVDAVQRGYGSATDESGDWSRGNKEGKGRKKQKKLTAKEVYKQA